MYLLLAVVLRLLVHTPVADFTVDSPVYPVLPQLQTLLLYLALWGISCH